MARPTPRFLRTVPVIAKISHRAWFSPEEYKKLYEATRKRAQEPKRKGFNWEAEQLHDFVLFTANTGLRPEEAWRLEFRDVTLVDDEDLGQTILETQVRGKRGVGYCKSMPGAVRPFERLRSRLRPARVDGVNTPQKSSVTSAAASEPWRLPQSTYLIFPKWQRELFKTFSTNRILASIVTADPYRLQSAAHVHLPAPDEGGRHLPNR